MDRIGRYKIVRELGRGAMGVVYHAIDPNIGRPVAIKTINLGAVLKPDEQERMRERLFREARSAGILSHPGIVTIYDVEQQGELAYIAMEYVDGPTLDHLLSQSQALAPERMFSILAQTAVALDYAHGKGIVHRDVKPANIMIAGDGTAKIADFGIAKITASEQFTMTGSIVGTPHYMSPEQVQGQPVDGRSDQFSLSVIAYEMLTGEKPYTGEHLTTVVYKIVAEEPPAPHRINSTLGPAIETVLRKGLAKKPEARYDSCQEFIGALEKACGETKGWLSLPRGGSLNATTVADRVLAPPVLAPLNRRSRPADVTTTNTTQRAPKPKGGFLPFLAAILMAAALLAVVAWEVKPTWLGTNTPQEQPKPQAQETTPPAPVSAPAEAKRHPVAPSAPSPAPEPQNPAQSASKGDASVRRPPPTRASSAPQPVQVVSSPAGAIASLDGQADTACTTPCTLEALPGRHSLELRKSGFDLEHRDVDVTATALELPTIVLRSTFGALMLTSEPAGAAILVNGKRQPQITPAQIQLPPGSYSVTVEWKDGKQATRTVQVKDGINYQKFLVGQ
jgi:serine/threonine protein kinase